MCDRFCLRLQSQGSLQSACHMQWMSAYAAGAVSNGWKLKRVSLLKLVCIETVRMEAVRVQQLPYVFQRLPLNTHGNLPLSEVCFLTAACVCCIVMWPFLTLKRCYVLCVCVEHHELESIDDRTINLYVGT